jgi:CBS domain-containing protein
MTPQDAAKIMADKDIGSVGVYSHSEGLIGIITKTDLVKYYFENLVGRKRVGDLMTIEFASTSSGDSLSRAASEMKNKKISRIFLKNQNDDLEGIMTFRDLFRVALNQGNSDSGTDTSNSAIVALLSRKALLSESGFGNTTLAKEVMSKNVISVDYNDDVTMACSAMLENKINGVGVKTNGRVSGVVSKTDIIKAIVTLN